MPSLRELVSKLGKPDALDLIPFGTVYSRANNLSEIRKSTMAHRPASPTRLMIGDYVNVPQNLPPEVIRNDASDLEAVPDQFKVVDVDVPPFSDEKMACVHVEPLRSRQRVLGLDPVIFWVFMFLIVIILAAGIGGGLGAGLSARSKNNGDSRYSILPFLCS